MNVSRRNALKLSILGGAGATFAGTTFTGTKPRSALTSPFSPPNTFKAERGPMAPLLTDAFERLYTEASEIPQTLSEPDFLRDRLHSLLQPGEVTMLDDDSLPYMLALECANRGERVVWMCMEGSGHQNVCRFLSTLSGVPTAHFAHGGDLYSNDWRVITNAAAQLTNLPIQLVELKPSLPPSLTPSISKSLQDVVQMDVLFLSHGTNWYNCAFDTIEEGLLEEKCQLHEVADKNRIPVVYCEHSDLHGCFSDPEDDWFHPVPLLQSANAAVYGDFRNNPKEKFRLEGILPWTIHIHRPNGPGERIDVLYRISTGRYHGLG